MPAKKTSPNDCPYIQELEDMLISRSKWNTMDDKILKMRMGERPKIRNYPYQKAPNNVVRIIDDTVREKTDQEMTMIWNTNNIAVFIPTGEVTVPENVRVMAQQAFDTYLRYICDYRKKKEQSVDTKNARGFCPVKITRRKHHRYGVIPDFEWVDPKDAIFPVDCKDPQEVDVHAHVLRMNKRTLLEMVDIDGWNKYAVNELVRLLSSKKDGEAEVTESTYDDQSTLKVTETLTGINCSDARQDKIVIWEIPHYARQWDVDHAGEAKIEKGRKCIAYICPDHPSLLLHIKPHREPDEFAPLSPEEQILEDIMAQEEGREPKTVKKVAEGRDLPWEFVQHRYENRSPYWYDTWGIGHTCLDNQIIATAEKNAKLSMIDYTQKPMFKQNGEAPTNQQNITVKPGTILPAGVEPIFMGSGYWQSLDFDIDGERRDASKRAATATYQYSENVNGQKEKTAAEVKSTDAKIALVSSASVQRFNDADKELFMQLWDDMRRLKVRLPIIRSGKFIGVTTDEMYQYEFIIVPAASERTLNPDLQFVKDQSIANFALAYAQMLPIDVGATIEYIVNHASPQMANVMFFDPSKQGPQGQPPVYNAIQKLSQGVGQHDQEIHDLQKLSIETADKVGASQNVPQK